MTKVKKFFAPKVSPICMSMHKRWFVYYDAPSHNGTGSKRVLVSGNLNKLNTLEERIKHAQELCADIIANRSAPTDKKPREHELMQLIALKPRLRKKTEQTYKSKVKIFCDWIQQKPIQKINREDAINFIDHLNQNKKSATTINAYKRSLAELFDMAIHRGIAKENPFSSIKKIKESRQSKMYFTTSQIIELKPLICSKHPQLWLACELLFYCFIRPEEIRNLTIGDIDYENRQIRIRGEFSKNGKTQFVAIPGSFYASIEKYKDYPGSNYVITKKGIPGAERMPVNYLSNKIREVLREKKYSNIYSLYSFKHTGAVMAIKAGVNIKELQIQLRHHSLDMVNEYLKNLGISDCASIVNLFPKI